MPRQLGRNVPLSLRRRHGGSPTYFKDRVSGAVYSFKTLPGYRYFDRHEEPNPHLVLFDQSKRSRFILSYEQQQSRGQTNLFIKVIQRETLHRIRGREVDVNAEAVENRNFRERLGGMHPGEFLLSEFISQRKEQIVKGTPVFLVLDFPEEYYGHLAKDKMAPSEHMKNYNPLIDRFFFKTSETVDFQYTSSGQYRSGPAKVVRLNINKERVKQLLGKGGF